MTREEAVKLIPPGWVECEQGTYLGALPGWRINYMAGHADDCLHGRSIYAIPAPKEPRRVPVVVGFWIEVESGNKYATVGSEMPDSMVGAQWRLDLDTREWVEVQDEN